jgi:hypothetical protein
VYAAGDGRQRIDGAPRVAGGEPDRQADSFKPQLCGVIASLLVTRYLSAMLFGVTATDPITFALLAVAVAGVSAVACYLAARRATRSSRFAAGSNRSSRRPRCP